jgi:Mor family transcriptional regulator
MTTDDKQRHEQILTEHARGMRIVEIARRHGLTWMQVKQIITANPKPKRWDPRMQALHATAREAWKEDE